MCNRMLNEGKRKSAIVYLTAAVILMCYLGKTVNCNRLTETEWRKEADATRRLGFKEGQIVFGRVFEKGSGLGPQVIDRTNKSTSNTSVEEDAEYQADSAGWGKEHKPNAGSREAAWKRMSPSLQCGWDQLKFRAVGPGASQFAVEQPNEPPLPLSQVPSTCGYIMQRNSFGLVMLVPYDGCNMVQKDESYVLPMRWQGHPVSIWCPKPPAPPQPQEPFEPQDPTPELETPTPPPPPTTINTLPEGHDHTLKYPFDRQYPFIPYYPFNPQYLVPEPETTPPVAVPEGHHHEHHSHKYPFDRQYPFISYYPFNLQYSTPEAEMRQPVAVPEGHHHHHSHKYPFDRQYPFNPYYPFFPQYPTPEPEMPPMTLPEGHHHTPKYPFDCQYPFNPYYPFFPRYPTLGPEMTPPALPEGHHVFSHKHLFNPYFPFNTQYPTPETTTTMKKN